MNEQSTGKAALWMAGSIACFLAMSVAGRTAMARLDVFQVLEMRSVIGWVMILPLVHRAGGFRAMLTSRPGLHVARNVVHYAGQFAWFYALALIPLAELVAIEFTTPLWTALWAVLFLGERLGRRKAMALALGIAGVLLIVRPAVAPLQTGQLVMLAGAVAFGATYVMVRSLTRTESTIRIIFWMLVIQSALGLFPALWAWRTPALETWPALLVVAFAGTFSHFCMARALSFGEATVVAPMDFARLPLSALLGYALYAERFDIWTGIGALVILSGNLFNIRHRRAATAKPAGKEPAGADEGTRTPTPFGTGT